MELKKMFYKCKAYYIIAISQFMRKVAYKRSFVISFFCRILSVLLYCFLWNAIYHNSKSEYINGFCKSEMIMYVIATFIIYDLISCEVAKNIGEDVRDGSIAMMLIKPISYRGNLIARNFGDYMYKLFFRGVIVFCCIELFKMKSIQITYWEAWNFVLFFLSVFLSFVIYSFFDFCFGMISMKTTYAFGMLLIKDAVLSFVSGQMIPFRFMPELLSDILQILPFSSMVYTPTMILLGQYDIKEVCIKILIQLIWALIMFSISGIVWRKNIKQITILGG